jgi:hypothetical protein
MKTFKEMTTFREGFEYFFTEYYNTVFVIVMASFMWYSFFVTNNYTFGIFSGFLYVGGVVREVAGHLKKHLMMEMKINKLDLILFHQNEEKRILKG